VDEKQHPCLALCTKLIQHSFPVLTELATALQKGNFSPEQRRALAKSIIKHYPPTWYDTPILFWALEMNDLIFLEEALYFHPPETRLKLILSPQGQVEELVYVSRGKVSVREPHVIFSNDTVLHVAAQRPECLKVILESLPAQQRIFAVSQAKTPRLESWHKYMDTPNTVLHLAHNNPQSLKTILELLPENQRFNAITLEKEIGQGRSITVLYNAYANPDSLKAILESFPIEKRLNLIEKTADENGDSILHYAALYPQSLEVILNLLPEHQRLEAILLPNKCGDTVLHWVFNDRDESLTKSLKLLLASLSKDHLLQAINTPNINGKTVMHLVAKAPSSLKTLLQFLPNPQKKDTKLLDIITADHPELLGVLAPFLEEQRLDAVVSVAENPGSQTMLIANSSPNSDNEFKLKGVTGPIGFWRPVIQSDNQNNNNTQISSLKS
jgi:hypothetical protein